MIKTLVRIEALSEWQENSSISSFRLRWEQTTIQLTVFQNDAIRSTLTLDSITIALTIVQVLHLDVDKRVKLRRWHHLSWLLNGQFLKFKPWCRWHLFEFALKLIIRDR